MQQIIAASAHKHGVVAEDIRHALANPIRIFTLDEGLTMVIGAGRTAALLEIGVVAGTDGLVVVHAMPARDKFLR